MPKTITDSTGNEAEFYTKEELDIHSNEIQLRAQEETLKKDEELKLLQDELTINEEKLKKLEGKDLNFANLRQQKDKAEKDIQSLKKEIDDKIGLAKKEILEGVMKDHYNETLKALTGDDKELLAKIEFQYKRLADTAATKEEITKKLTDSYLLATKKEDEGVLNSSVISSGGVSRITPKTDKKFTPEEKNLARKLASAGGLKLEDKDFI